MRYRLLTVSADNIWAQDVAKVASSCGHAAAHASTAADALKRVLAGDCELLLLDADLPALEGLRWLEALRATEAGRAVAVLVASRHRSDDDLARAFELGADDYIEKACAAVELAARLRSVLRRRFERAAPADAPVVVGPVTLDPGSHECRVRSTVVALNPREFELLETLMRQAGRVLSRAYLLETVWRMDRFSNTRAVDVSISRLRKALGPRAARWLETVERYGYRFKSSVALAR